MPQRILLGGGSLSAAAIIVVVWLASTARPVMAMEAMAKSIRQAKSYSVLMTQETIKVGAANGKMPVKAKLICQIYWAAPGSAWSEMKGDVDPRYQGLISIRPAGKPGVDIHPKRKEFEVTPASLGAKSPLTVLDGLSRYSGEADRDLGTKVIDGRKSHGFIIDARKIDPSTFEGSAEVWVDSESNLPIEVSYLMKLPGIDLTLRYSDFHWNVDLAPGLFDTSPPPGYTETTNKFNSKVSPNEQVPKIVNSLRFYSELSKGKYPQVKVIYGDVMHAEMLKLAGKRHEVELDESRDPTVLKINGERGFAIVTGIQRNNPDAAYHGLTVGPKDADKVLLRWKLEDGRYQVIYGDLRSEVVSKEELDKLEAR